MLSLNILEAPEVPSLLKSITLSTGASKSGDHLEKIARLCRSWSEHHLLASGSLVPLEHPVAPTLARSVKRQ